MHINLTMEYAQILAAAFSFIFFFFSFFFYYHFKNIGSSSHVSLPVNWPIFGMIPSILLNIHRFPEWVADTLRESHGTFLIKGPWFSKMELLFTADPANIDYVQCKHHVDFHKGVNFNNIFDVLGDGIFNSDGAKWKYQRKIALSTITSPRFHRLVSESIEDKIMRGLIPVLQHSCSCADVVDLQDLFQRLMSDFTYMVLLGHDPNELSLEALAADRCNTHRHRLHEGEEAILQRHLTPSLVWKLQRWLRIGKEGRLKEIGESMDAFFYNFLERKREHRGMERRKEGGGSDLISAYIEKSYGKEGYEFKSFDIFLRDTFVTLLLAGQDTLSSALTWFFWVMAMHPWVEAKLRAELMRHDFGQGCNISQLGDESNLVFLHATLCETLRLYPPIPFNHKASKKPETLPSGHRVKPWTMIILSAYAMGRMKWVWGEDCEEFKPERWITDEGKIKREPSSKFFAFNTGPRICLGKEMSFVIMKAVVCQVMRHNYRFEVVEGHRAEITPSVVLWMKNGLKVKVIKS